MNKLGLALAFGGAMLTGGAASAAPILWDTASGGNGHYYELVTTGETWGGALAAAGALSFMGRDGYLTTLTSAAESTFIRDNVTSASYWAAGSDSTEEGVWRWMAGPELGLVFWNFGAVSGVYSGWNAGEPNNSAEEDALQANWSGINWNDAQAGNRLAYVVEYGPAQQTGGVPEPSTWAMLILGFGAAGGVIRRRRSAPAFA